MRAVVGARRQQRRLEGEWDELLRRDKTEKERGAEE